MTDPGEDVTTVEPDSFHWRWVCSCGRKGIRLLYKDSAERLAEKHRLSHIGGNGERP